MSNYFSLTQIVGYAAFVLGVASFLQKSDRHFKLYMTGECVAYAVHFALLGNLAATASSLVSMTRSLLSLKTRALWIALAIVAINIGLGIMLVKVWWQALPLIASSIATLALFRLQGIRMRLVLLCGTLMWLVNNWMAGSIGGTALEAVVACVNVYTIIRLYREPSQAA